MLFLEVVNHPLPEVEWLGMGIVDPEDEYPMMNPELDDALEFLPEAAPGRRLEIEWIDVLVLLGRVLGILDCAVRSSAKPFRMFFHVGMVRRTLVRQIQSNVDSMRLCYGDEMAEIFECPKAGMNRLVAAFRAAHSPWASRLSRRGLNGIVLSLAMRA